ncbi:MAG: DUF433 domain-containing protein [Candidatus Limnocylindrales bacterium]
MTIKWVKVDPLVMNGEPFCYGSRLTVRNVLEMRASGLAPGEIQAQHPELRKVGLAEVYRYAAEQRGRYADFFARDGSLRGPGFTVEGAADLPEHLRELVGVVITPAGPANPG